jgi:hypothetical protein
LTCLAFNTAQAYRLQAGERLASLAIRRLQQSLVLFSFWSSASKTSMIMLMSARQYVTSCGTLLRNDSLLNEMPLPFNYQE